jgi:hypothetical protein
MSSSEALLRLLSSKSSLDKTRCVYQSVSVDTIKKRRLHRLRRKLAEFESQELERRETSALINWLNDNRWKAEKKRVVRLVELIRQAREATPVVTMPEFIQRDMSSDEGDGNAWNLVQEINLHLRKFRIGPRINQRTTPVALDPENKARRERSSRFGWTWWSSQGSRAAYAIVRLEQQGIFDLLRQCQACKKWLLAKRRKQHFCSAKCRDRDYRTSDGGRKKRTEYMQGYRARLRRMDEAHLMASREKRR